MTSISNKSLKIAVVVIAAIIATITITAVFRLLSETEVIMSTSFRSEEEHQERMKIRDLHSDPS